MAKFNSGLPPKEKEIEILKHLSTGKSQGEVAKAIFRSIRTVETYIYLMKKRYRCGSTGQLLLKAQRQGWLG